MVMASVIGRVVLSLLKIGRARNSSAVDNLIGRLTGCAYYFLSQAARVIFIFGARARVRTVAFFQIIA